MSEKQEVVRWRIDKNIPLSLLVAIGVQSIGIAWWAATQTANIENNRASIELIQSTERSNASTSMEIKERLVRVETSVTMQSASLGRIEDLIRYSQRKAVQ